MVGNTRWKAFCVCAHKEMMYAMMYANKNVTICSTGLYIDPDLTDQTMLHDGYYTHR